MNTQMLIGKVVISRAGRDQGRYYIIIKVIDEKYVYVADGKYRKLLNPKKKKLKHLIMTNLVSENIREKILKGEKITNLMLQNFLQSVDGYKEG